MIGFVPPTPLELLGIVLLGSGLLGFAALGVELWRERGKPGHDHEEGEPTPDGRPCARCVLDAQQRN